MSEGAGAAGFVLAGGQSVRMGRDKALLGFAGQPLIGRAVGILRTAGLRTAIAGVREDLAEWAPIVRDREAGQGPLGGVCGALESMEERWGVFLTVDVPLLPPSLIEYLLRHAQVNGAAVTIASVGGEAQTFPAVLDRAVLPALKAELEGGRLKCLSAWKSAAAALGRPMTVAAVEPLVQVGQIAHPAGLAATHWFLNVNTADELRLAESLAGRAIA